MQLLKGTPPHHLLGRDSRFALGHTMTRGERPDLRGDPPAHLPAGCPGCRLPQDIGTRQRKAIPRLSDSLPQPCTS